MNEGKNSKKLKNSLKQKTSVSIKTNKYTEKSKSSNKVEKMKKIQKISTTTKLKPKISDKNLNGNENILKKIKAKKCEIDSPDLTPLNNECNQSQLKPDELSKQILSRSLLTDKNTNKSHFNYKKKILDYDEPDVIVNENENNKSQLKPNELATSLISKNKNNLSKSFLALSKNREENKLKKDYLKCEDNLEGDIEKGENNKNKMKKNNIEKNDKMKEKEINNNNFLQKKTKRSKKFNKSKRKKIKKNALIDFKINNITNIIGTSNKINLNYDNSSIIKNENEKENIINIFEKCKLYENEEKNDNTQENNEKFENDKINFDFQDYSLNMQKTDSFDLTNKNKFYIKNSKVSLNLNSLFNYNPAINIYQIRPSNDFKNKLLIPRNVSCKYCKFDLQLLSNHGLGIIEKILNEIKMQYFQVLNLIIVLDKLSIIVKILENYL